MPRMRILTAPEQEAFDKPPRFDDRERKKAFEFPRALLNMAKSMRSRGHRIGFLVSCEYFWATRRFFAPAHFDPRDIAYVARQLDAGVSLQSPIPLAHGNGTNSAFSNFMASPPSARTQRRP